MALGTAIYVTSMLLMSAAGSYRDYLLAQGVLSGLGVGMLYVTPAFDVVCVPRSSDDLMQVLTTTGGHLDAFQQVPGDSAGNRDGRIRHRSVSFGLSATPVRC